MKRICRGVLLNMYLWDMMATRTTLATAYFYQRKKRAFRLRSSEQAPLQQRTLQSLFVQRRVAESGPVQAAKNPKGPAAAPGRSPGLDRGRVGETGLDAGGKGLGLNLKSLLGRKRRRPLPQLRTVELAAERPGESASLQQAEEPELRPSEAGPPARFFVALKRCGKVVQASNSLQSKLLQVLSSGNEPAKQLVQAACQLDNGEEILAALFDHPTFDASLHARETGRGEPASPTRPPGAIPPRNAEGSAWPRADSPPQRPGDFDRNLRKFFCTRVEREACPSQATRGPNSSGVSGPVSRFSHWTAAYEPGKSELRLLVAANRAIASRRPAERAPALRDSSVNASNADDDDRSVFGKSYRRMAAQATSVMEDSSRAAATHSSRKLEQTELARYLNQVYLTGRLQKLVPSLLSTRQVSLAPVTRRARKSFSEIPSVSVSHADSAAERLQQ